MLLSAGLQLGHVTFRCTQLSSRATRLLDSSRQHHDCFDSWRELSLNASTVWLVLMAKAVLPTTMFMCFFCSAGCCIEHAGLIRGESCEFRDHCASGCGAHDRCTICLCRQGGLIEQCVLSHGESCEFGALGASCDCEAHGV
jgi:hypothetical protein